MYSRITGYYRPVQNWNDGKAQEYKERKVYDIANSKLQEKEAVEEVAAEAPATEACEDAAMLFTTKTCPNCRIVCGMLEDAGIAYKKIDADEAPELVAQFGIRQAPTLVVVKDGQANIYANASSIIAYIEEH